MKDSRVKDLVSGGCFFVLGLFIAFRSVGFKIWGGVRPQEGFFPFITGILMIGLSLVVVGKALLSPLHDTSGDKQSAAEEEAGFGSPLKVVFYAVSISCYAVLLQPVGFLITTPVFLVLILKVVERQSWKIAISVTLALTASSYILFVYLLMVPLPKGLLK